MNNLIIKDKEIDLLNTEMKTAYTLIDLLMKRVDDLEKKENSKLEPVKLNPNIQEQTRQTVNKCLLLADSNLRRVRQSDLGRNCSVKTIPEANINLLKSWVREQMHTIPQECIIYCGLYDISEGLSPENILNSLGSLINDLRAKNSKMEIYICQVSPVPSPLEIQRKILEYNDHLMKWGKLNGVNIINTLCHTIGTGEVDDFCFEKDNKIYYILSRLGVTRLLSTLDRYSQGFQVCKDWENVKRQSITMFSNKTNDTIHKPQPQRNTIQLVTTLSAKYYNMPKQSAYSPQAQEVQFHAHTKTHPTHLLTSEPSDKSTIHTPNTWHRPQTNPIPLRAPPHSTPVNKQTYQNHNVRGVAGQNRTPYHIRDNRSIRQTFYPHTPQHRSYLPNNTDSYPHTPHYRPYLPQNNYSYPHTPQYRQYIHNNTDSHPHTPQHRSYLLTILIPIHTHHTTDPTSLTTLI